MALLEFTDHGIYCPQADVYIDPWKPVKRALITHGHGDHARAGSDYYLCTRSAHPVIRYRLGPIHIETLDYGETRLINGVRFSFHPAGHIVGSAQIRVEFQGEIWVASGDYKLEDDGLAEIGSKARYRQPDDVTQPGKAIQQLIPSFQKVGGAKAMASHLKAEANSSRSFHAFVTGVRRLWDDGESKGR
jgi:hypothetical protein